MTEKKPEMTVYRDILFCSKSDVDNLKQLLKEAGEYVTMVYLEKGDPGANELRAKIVKALGITE